MTKFFISIKEGKKQEEPLEGRFSQTEASEKAEQARQAFPKATISVNKEPEKR